jgi:hypothetical protein
LFQNEIELKGKKLFLKQKDFLNEISWIYFDCFKKVLYYNKYYYLNNKFILNLNFLDKMEFNSKLSIYLLSCTSLHIKWKIDTICRVNSIPTYTYFIYHIQWQNLLYLFSILEDYFRHNLWFNPTCTIFFVILKIIFKNI